MTKIAWIALLVLTYLALTVFWTWLAYDAIGLWGHIWRAGLAGAFFFYLLFWSQKLGKEVGM